MAISVSAGIVKKLKDFPESTKVVRKVQLTKLGSVVKASEKSICAITDSITDSIRRKKKVEDITWGGMVDKRSWQEERGQDKKSGDVDGYLGEKRRKRGVDGISVGEEGGPVVGKLGPAVRHSGHYSGRERETIAGKCLCRKEVPSNEIQDDARANLAGKVQTVGKA